MPEFLKQHEIYWKKKERKFKAEVGPYRNNSDQMSTTGSRGIMGCCVATPEVQQKTKLELCESMTRCRHAMSLYSELKTNTEGVWQRTLSFFSICLTILFYSPICFDFIYLSHPSIFFSLTFFLTSFFFLSPLPLFGLPLSVSLSYLFTLLSSIDRSVYLLLSLSNSVYWSIYLSVCLSIYYSAYLYIYLTLSVGQSICRSVCLSITQPIYMSI